MFRQNCANFCKIIINFIKFHQIFANFAKISAFFDGILLKFRDSSSARMFKSCRSRKTLQKEYLVVKIGVDTAENGPSKVSIILGFLLENARVTLLLVATAARRSAIADLGPKGPGESASTEIRRTSSEAPA